ncbi:MAG: MBL fold metallo-hydrolase [Candidatus Sungiibacteriota bacterium]|uniref:MBL fold metallo-hydrolase n=1 Tax=Candidatus Sungiibacteriota bacterium TaxID=2750080 RepID=A0A7T5UR14_9BACT|nr:MAG: MBL fold metallo-hydrolase [Candidatus Sungbacteria bacterium]
MEKSSKNAKLISLIILATVSVTIWYAVFYFEARQNLIVNFFDVGQGDAIFIEVPDGNQILIDGGPNDKILSRLGGVMPFWDRDIDLLVLTHPHADHLDGLLEVLKRYNIGQVLESGAEHSIPEYQEWRDLLRTKNVPVFVAQRGQKVKAGGAVFVVLAPFENYGGKTLKNIHDATVILKMNYGSTTALFTGDAEKQLEYRLLWSNSDIKSDILKVGHHGSKTSTSEEFLKAVSPKFAVVQVGRKNRYGHPAQEVLDRIAGAGVALFRVDLDRDTEFVSNGLQFWQK